MYGVYGGLVDVRILLHGEGVSLLSPESADIAGLVTEKVTNSWPPLLLITMVASSPLLLASWKTFRRPDRVALVSNAVFILISNVVTGLTAHIFRFI